VAVLNEATPPRWDEVRFELASARRREAPLLAAAALSIHRSLVLGMLRRLFAGGQAAAAPALAGFDALMKDDEDAVAVFCAAATDDGRTIERIAARRAVDSEALQSVASLLPMPLLQAAHRRLGDKIDRGWRHGYCPLCGSWPAFAEALGTERGRRFRCGRCAAGWPAPPLRCPFCATTDHTAFVRLVAGGDRQQAAIEACARCSSYVKTFAALQPRPSLEVMIQDLDTLDLDYLAVRNGYTRPPGVGYCLELQLRIR